jgi:hypothetical protein
VLELANFSFSMIVLYSTRMSACRLANHNVAKPDYSIVGLHRQPTNRLNFRLGKVILI